MFVYENVEGQLVHAQTIVPPDVGAADKFGISMAMDSGRLAVGSLFSRNPSTGFRTGAVFIYEFDGVQWVEVDRVWAEPPVYTEFGKKVALHDDTLIVTTQRGRSSEVYAWEDPGGWRHVQTVTQPDPDGPAIGFGIQWAIRDDWFITGGPLDRRTFPAGGEFFIYRRNAEGGLDLVQEILADESLRLGITVDFAGETLVAGAPLASPDEEFQGVVRFYEYDGERWVLDGELAIFDFLAFGAAFGAAFDAGCS